MSITYDNYRIEEETFLKASILSRGIAFTENSIRVSELKNAKGQNLVYNMPLNATNNRPQELIIKNTKDSYSVVVSCVSDNPNSIPVLLDADEENQLFAVVDGKIIENVEIHFIEEPSYYTKKLLNGEAVKKYISACGLDELNIIPWKGCAISRGCKFCGINNFINPNDLSAHKISRDNNEWNSICEDYLSNLEEAILIAKTSSCYKEHAHVILIAGNLDNNKLDFEAEIFSKIAERVSPLVKDISNEGLVAVITPPSNPKCIDKLKNAGVEKVVFNIEAITESGFEKYCPGKSDLGYQFFVDRLRYAINIFGKGNVWTNLVLGLEKTEDTLEQCAKLVADGIVISANVLHLDKGNSLDCGVPSTMDVIDFFYNLETINNQEGFVPFYCAKALRTSLSNEAHDTRIKERDN